MRKTILLIMIIAILSFSGCKSKGISHGEVKTNPSADIKVFEYGSSYINSGLYGYIMSEEKTDYLYISSEYSKYISGAEISDTESFWKMKGSDNRTFGEILTENINDICKKLVIVKEIASKNGVTVTNKDDLKTINDTMEDLINSHGSEDDFDHFLYKFGIKTGDVRGYYDNIFLVDALKDHFFGENGSMKIPGNEIMESFHKNYVKFTFIYYKFDDAAGETPDETRERIKALYDDIVSGKEKFEDHTEESSDEKNTLIVGKGETYSDFEEKVFAAAAGEYVYTEYGTKGIYIVRKEALSDDDIGDFYEKVNDSLADDAFDEYLKQYYDSVIMNNTELNKFDIATADTFD